MLRRPRSMLPPCFAFLSHRASPGRTGRTLPQAAGYILRPMAGRPWGIGLALAIAMASVPAAMGGCGGSEFSSTGGGTGGGASGTGGGSGAGGGGASCGSGRCVPKAPEGWLGPVTVSSTSGGDVECAGDYPTAVFTRFTGILSEPAECDCACDEMVTCDAMNLILFGSVDCSGTNCAKQPVVSGCVPLGTAVSTCGTPKSFVVEGGTSGSCNPQTLTDTPPAKWAKTYGACATAAPPESCDDGAGDCLPPVSAGARFCIHKDGTD